MKKILARGFVAGLLASIASVVYFEIYQRTLLTEFDQIINAGSIVGASLMACMLISLGYIALYKINRPNLHGWFNVLVFSLSFASIVGPIGVSLPLGIDSPELFPGLVVPMHFFPALVYFGIGVFFDQTGKHHWEN